MAFVRITIVLFWATAASSKLINPHDVILFGYEIPRTVAYGAILVEVGLALGCLFRRTRLKCVVIGCVVLLL
jgi:hypothetical protein